MFLSWTEFISLKMKTVHYNPLLKFIPELTVPVARRSQQNRIWSYSFSFNYQWKAVYDAINKWRLRFCMFTIKMMSQKIVCYKIISLIKVHWFNKDKSKMGRIVSNVSNLFWSYMHLSKIYTYRHWLESSATAR